MESQTESNPELIADFVDEALESLRTVPNELIAYRSHPDNAAPINAVFRAIHSIKGCAGFLGLSVIKNFSHTLENTLDEVRKEKVSLCEDLERHFIEGFDILDELLNQALDGSFTDEMSDREKKLLQKVEETAAGCRNEFSQEDKLIQDLNGLCEKLTESQEPQTEVWAGQLQIIIDNYQGQVSDNEEEEQQPETAEKQNPLDLKQQNFEYEGSDLTEPVLKLLEMFITTNEDGYSETLGAQFLQSIQDFILSLKENNHNELSSSLENIATDFRTLFESPLDIDSMLLSVIWEKLEPVLTKLQLKEPQAEEVKDDAQPNAAEDTNTSKEIKATEKQAQRSRVVRIKEEVVDNFLNEVSSLFITCELFKDLQSRMIETGEITHLVEEMRQINHQFVAQTTELQQDVVALRRVSVSGLFSKFPRMARGLASQLDKKVDVQLVGEEVEIDKSLVEDLDAPLTHMIRNSMDHGIDTPAERLARGVPEVGTLTLKAELSRTHVIITIHDDGRGIDPNILRKKSVEKGLYTAEQAAALSDQEAIELVFHAGLSTAKEVSDVSGRGVGMDVVRATLQDHNGNVTVESEFGVGTTFKLEIPIREAVLVIDGLMLETAKETYVLPFEFVREITELDHSELKPVQGSQVATIRGNSYAAKGLSELLSLKESHSSDSQPKQSQAVIVGSKKGDLCLLVDRVLGHRQVVVNSIKDILPSSDNIAGVAQLGGGRLALVLSVEDLVSELQSQKAELVAV